MTRPAILDLDLVVVPRDTGDAFANSSLPKEMIDAGYDVLEQCDVDLMNSTGPDWDYGMEAVATYGAMLSASPYPTAWDDVRKYVEGLEEEVGRLEDENSELRYEPWPEWARAVLKVIRSHTGYDGYDDATEGVDMPLELSEHLSQVESDTDRWKARALTAEARIAELEKRLADAERVIEPFAAVEPMNVWHETEEDEGYHSLTENQFRAARAYMEGK